MTSPVYATAQELIVYLAADNLLEQASRLIDSVLRGAVYATDANGVATDPEISTAIKNATMIQVSFWKAGYGNPHGSPIYSTVSIGSVTLSGAGNAGTKGDGVKTSIAPQALYELESAGLLPIFAGECG
jgi:hypothetical protein